MIASRRTTLSAAAIACAGCAVPAPAPHVEPTIAEWGRTRAELAQLRARVPESPYVANVSLTMHDPITGRAFDGRGAVAVDRARGVRMILVGPAGATALDAWITREKYRFAVPALGIVRRGGPDRPPDPALPVGFFRWWFLAPLDGQLLTAVDPPGARTWVLRDGASTSELTILRGDAVLQIDARRREPDKRERLTWRGRSFAPRAGDSGTYRDEGSGLAVDVRIESVSDEPPAKEAFADPDGPEGAR